MKATLIALTGLLTAASFCACDNNDDDNNNATMLNSTDSSFIIMAGMSNTAEIQTSQLADPLSTDTAIMSFAQMMITDHTAAQNELKPLATKYGLTAPDAVDSAHAALKTILMSLSGRALDSVYIHNQFLDHQKTIEFFEDERDNGNNVELKSFAAGKLPSLQMHLEHADSLAANY